MPGATCNHIFACPYMCKISNTSKKLPMPTSLSTVQLHIAHMNFVAPTTALVTVNFCFDDSALF